MTVTDWEEGRKAYLLSVLSSCPDVTKIDSSFQSSVKFQIIRRFYLVIGGQKHITWTFIAP